MIPSNGTLEYEQLLQRSRHQYLLLVAENNKNHAHGRNLRMQKNIVYEYSYQCSQQAASTHTCVNGRISCDCSCLAADVGIIPEYRSEQEQSGETWHHRAKHGARKNSETGRMHLTVLLYCCCLCLCTSTRRVCATSHIQTSASVGFIHSTRKPKD